MAYELRDGSGSLFKNDNREKETHAHYKGDIMIDGKAYWLSAWIKEGKTGKYFSLSAKPKEARQEQAKPKSGGSIMDLETDIPFNNPYKGRIAYVV